MMALVFSSFQLRKLLELSQIIEWNVKSCNVEFAQTSIVEKGASVNNFIIQGPN